MKYALISDIHGNLPAFEAVLADAKKRGVHHFWLLGDYVEDLPFPNEVVEIIRQLDNAWIIRGNKEDYLQNMKTDGKADLSVEQFAPITWNYQTLTDENLNYLLSLPATLQATTPSGNTVRLLHSSPIFFRRPRIMPLHSAYWQDKIDPANFSRKSFLETSQKAVLAHKDAMEEISKLQDTVYAFGHNHLQWHMLLDGKCLINPGSCGIPLDSCVGAAYSILEETSDGWRVEELRVPYDLESCIRELTSSSLFVHAEIWSRIIIKNLRCGVDYLSPFLAHVEALAKERNQMTNPVNNEIWREAAASFPFFDIYAIQ